MKSAAVVFSILVLGIGIVIVSAQDDAGHGKTVYDTQKCSICHSISGVGGKRLSLDGVGSRLKPEEIRRWVRTPKEMKSDTTMKAYPNLPEKDLNDLTAFLMTLK